MRCPISFIVHLPVANGIPSQRLSFTDISISFLTPGSSIPEFQISTYPFANSPRKIVVALCFNVPKDTDSLNFGDYRIIGRGMINQLHIIVAFVWFHWFGSSRTIKVIRFLRETSKILVGHTGYSFALASQLSLWICTTSIELGITDSPFQKRLN